MKYQVERMLPAEFLLRQGIYIQTCAQIELTVWQIVLETEGVPVDSDTIPTSFVDIKTRTYDLRQSLRGAVKKLPASIGLQLLKLAGDIDDGVINRNTAAHGAFYLDGISGRLHVAHYYKQRIAKDKIYYSVEGDVSDEMIREALEEADRILLEAISIRSKVQEAIAKERLEYHGSDFRKTAGSILTLLTPPPPSSHRRDFSTRP